MACGLLIFAGLWVENADTQEKRVIQNRVGQTTATGSIKLNFQYNATVHVFSLLAKHMIVCNSRISPSTLGWGACLLDLCGQVTDRRRTYPLHLYLEWELPRHHKCVCRLTIILCFCIQNECNDRLQYGQPYHAWYFTCVGFGCLSKKVLMLLI